jgi:hypothetical protein
MPRSTVKLTCFKGSGEPSKPSQPTGGQKKRRTLASLPNVSKVPFLSEVKGFLLEKGQSGKTELSQNPKQSLRGKRIR